jgi:hypothetical protein
MAWICSASVPVLVLPILPVAAAACPVAAVAVPAPSTLRKVRRRIVRTTCRIDKKPHQFPREFNIFDPI